MIKETKLFQKTDVGSLQVDSVATITFYQGKAPIDYVDNKVKAIIECNPWLEGKIVSKGKDLYLSYLMQPEQKSFLTIRRPNLRHDMASFNEIGDELNEYRIKKGNIMINSNEQLFRVVLVLISDDLFGLFLSISHGIADGTTRYRLYGMLDHATTPTPLNPYRDDEFESLVDEVHGDDMKWATSAGLAMNIAAGAIFGKTHDSIMRYINRDYVDEIKKQYTTSDSFVSTNDVLCSNLSTICGFDIVVMAVNHRALPRFEKYTANDAGNYLGIVALHKDDFASPVDVRSSLCGLCRAKSGSPPGFWATYFGQVSFISNWSTIYRNASLPGCEQQLHIPIVLRRDLILPSCIVIFIPKEGELAMLLIDRHLPTILSKAVLNRITRI